MVTVLFACTHNAGRSQMAAALFNLAADPGRARAISAGTQPAARVHPGVVAAMLDLGVDLAGAAPRRLTPELAAQSNWLVTMGCGEECPVVPGIRREDWPVADPKDRPADQVRAIRDDIGRRVAALVDREGWRVMIGPCRLSSERR
jgi:arsenate reductase